MALDIDLPSDCLPEQGCITCGDTAVSMFVERVDESRGLALCATAEGARQTVETELVGDVEVGGVHRNVNIGLLDSDGQGVGPGDWVLIHVGFAMSKVDEEEALATLQLLQGMGEEYEQELEELKASVIE